MSAAESDRAKLIAQVVARTLTQRRAARLLGLSERQVRRLVPAPSEAPQPSAASADGSVTQLQLQRCCAELQAHRDAAPPPERGSYYVFTGSCDALLGAEHDVAQRRQALAELRRLVRRSGVSYLPPACR